jgi:hypothetical protein
LTTHFISNVKAKTGTGGIYTEPGKVGAATNISEESKVEDFSGFDLKERVSELARMILDANGMSLTE